MRLLLLLLLLLAPTLLLARPSVFADTPLYYGQGQALVRAALGPLAGPLDPAARADPFATVPGSLGARTGALEVAGARSPTYGLILYLAHRLGGLRALAGVQAALAALAAGLFLNVFAPRSLLALALGGAVLALGASLPFFAAFAMPDVFAGPDLLLIAVLLVGRPGRSETLLALALLSLGAAVHPTHLLTLALLIPTAPLMLRALFGTPLGPLKRPLALLALAAGLALALEGAERALLEGASGRKEGQPPFLMARLLEDGPGRTYLARACPGGAAPILCRFRARRLDDSETFLWSGQPDAGVVMTLAPAERAQLKAEEGPFALAVARAEPLEVARGAAEGVLRQLALFAVVEPLHSPAEFAVYPFWRHTQIFVHDRECAGSGRCAPLFPRWVLALEESLVLLFGLAAAVRAFRRQGAPHGESGGEAVLALKQAFVVLALGVFVNAALCGALSGVFPRYEARLIWVLPFCGVVLMASLRTGAVRSSGRDWFRSAASAWRRGRRRASRRSRAGPPEAACPRTRPGSPWP